MCDVSQALRPARRPGPAKLRQCVNTLKQASMHACMMLGGSLRLQAQLIAAQVNLAVWHAWAGIADRNAAGQQQ